MILETASRREYPGVAGDLSAEDLPGPARGPGEDGVEDGVTGGLCAGVNVHMRSCVNTTYLGQSLAAAS